MGFNSGFKGLNKKLKALTMQHRAVKCQLVARGWRDKLVIEKKHCAWHHQAFWVCSPNSEKWL